MSYCTFTDIESDFKGIVFAPGQMVTDTAVTQFIAEAAAYINSYVGSRYVIPIADTEGLALMSLFARTLVSDRIRGILSNKQATNVDANQNVKAQGMSTSDVIKALTAIRDGITPIPGATLILANAGFFSNNQANNEQPRFQKNVKSW